MRHRQLYLRYPIADRLLRLGYRRIARDANQASARASEVTWICAGAENPGLTDVKFDFVFNVDAIHHFEDRRRVFNEINRLLLEAGTICVATDSEQIIRNRKPLSTYWPETIELELARYPRVETLDTELGEAGFVNVRHEEVSVTDWLRDLSPYRTKVFSVLSLLPEDIYERGLRRLEADLTQGPIESISRYLLLWAHSLP
ncbi:MAG: methyltransferase domain-containing protein [Verrucomicrobia bacterium]|nr:methyltransferase domain-containing protein [Verrucomicrobiota bacterium]